MDSSASHFNPQQLKAKNDEKRANSILSQNVDIARSRHSSFSSKRPSSQQLDERESSEHEKRFETKASLFKSRQTGCKSMLE